jgi:hypothetical protein
MPSTRLLRKTGWLAAAGIGFLFFCTIDGCGRKLPPIQPGAFRPPTVADLSYEVSGGQILLVWSIPAFNPAKESEASGFRVLRSRLTADEAECPTCRVAFQMIGDIAAAGRRPGNRVKFRDALEPGFQHRYKIRSYTTDGMVGTDSNTVVVID